MSEEPITLDVEAMAERLRHLREMLGITQVAMAARLGMQVTRWNNYERGVGPVQAPEILRLKRMFPGLTSDWILEGDRKGLTMEIAERLDAVAEAAAPAKKRGRPTKR